MIHTSTKSTVKIDLHMHSLYSRDSLNKLEDIITTCQKKGLDILCLTDHNEVEGALRLRDISPLPVIVGQEITTTKGEIIAYFLEELVPSGLSPEQAIQCIRAQGGIVSVPHPLDAIRKEAMGRENLMTIIDQVDALEVFNARCLLSRFNQEAKYLANKYNLPGTAGSDAHSLVEIATTYLEMPSFDGRDEFLENLKYASIHGRRSFPLVHWSSWISKRIKRWRNRTGTQTYTRG